MHAETARRLARCCDDQAPAVERALRAIAIPDDALLGFVSERKLLGAPRPADFHLYTTRRALAAIHDIPVDHDDRRHAGQPAIVSYDHPYSVDPAHTAVSIVWDRDDPRDRTTAAGRPFAPEDDLQFVLALERAIPGAELRWLGRYPLRAATTRAFLKTRHARSLDVLAGLGAHDWRLDDRDLRAVLASGEHFRVDGINVGVRDGAVAGGVVGFDVEAGAGFRWLERRGLLRAPTGGPRRWLKLVASARGLEQVQEYRADFVTTLET